MVSESRRGVGLSSLGAFKRHPAQLAVKLAKTITADTDTFTKARWLDNYALQSS